MSSVRGISQYQQAMFSGYGGFSSASGSDASRSGSASVQAKVVTKTIGFQLGKFGVSFASEEVQVDPESLSKAALALTGTSLSADSFAAEMDVAAVRDSLAMAQTLDYSAADSADASFSASGPTALTRRLGARAYAQAGSFTGRSDAASMFQASV